MQMFVKEQLTVTEERSEKKSMNNHESSEQAWSLDNRLFTETVYNDWMDLRAQLTAHSIIG